MQRRGYERDDVRRRTQQPGGDDERLRSRYGDRRGGAGSHFDTPQRDEAGRFDSRYDEESDERRSSFDRPDDYARDAHGRFGARRGSAGGQRDGGEYDDDRDADVDDGQMPYDYLRRGERGYAQRPRGQFGRQGDGGFVVGGADQRRDEHSREFGLAQRGWSSASRPAGGREGSFGHGAADDFGGPHAGRGPQGYQRSDERIREEICDRLTQHSYLDASTIEVTVREGEIVLSGTVASRAEKRLAEDLAESAPGATDVRNELRVQPQPDSRLGLGNRGGSEAMAAQSTGRQPGGASAATSAERQQSTNLRSK